MPSSLTLESKTKVDLTLEGNRGTPSLTLADATWPLSEASGTLASPKVSLTKESKTKVSLSLEAKL